MRMTRSQAQRFYDTLTPLLMWSADRLNICSPYEVVDGADPTKSEQLRSNVLHDIWELPEIIDEYVSINPFNLGKKALEQTRAWKNRLPGPCILTGLDNKGRALFLADDRLIAVAGIFDEPIMMFKSALAQVPVPIDITLLPFEGLITYDSIYLEYPIGYTDNIKHMLNDFVEEAKAQPVITEEPEFIAYAKASEARQKQRDLEKFERKLMLDEWEREGNEPLPQGVRKGALTGLTEEEREAAIKEHIEYIKNNDPRYLEIKKELEKETAADAKADKSNTGAKPKTIQAKAKRIGHLAEVLTELCGIVSIDDLPAAYEQLYNEAIDTDTIHKGLDRYLDYLDDEADFEFWKDPKAKKDEGGLYVIHYYMGNDEVMQDCTVELRNRLKTKMKPGMSIEDLLDQISDEDVLKFDKKIEAGLQERDESLGYILGEQALKKKYGMVELDSGLAKLSAYEWKFKLPEVVSLRNWLDAHVPEGEDEYLFAESMLDELLDAQMANPNPSKEVMNCAEALGLFELSSEPDPLINRLMTFVNSLPSWENNGWSPKDLHDKQTGRKTFYNEDGTPMKVGRNDPCPCGSGKKYKKCCGRQC